MTCIRGEVPKTSGGSNLSLISGKASQSMEGLPCT